MAVVGGGNCSILESIDNQLQLEHKVRNALSKALEPSLKNCTISSEYLNKIEDLEQLNTISRH